MAARPVLQPALADHRPRNAHRIGQRLRHAGADGRRIAISGERMQRHHAAIAHFGAIGAPVRGRRVGVILSGGNVDLGWALSARNTGDTPLIQES